MVGALHEAGVPLVAGTDGMPGITLQGADHGEQLLRRRVVALGPTVGNGQAALQVAAMDLGRKAASRRGQRRRELPALVAKKIQENGDGRVDHSAVVEQ